MEVVVHSHCCLGECPVWNSSLNALFWCDIECGEIWRYCPDTGDAGIIAKLDMKVGGFAFTPENEMILCSDKGVFRLRLKSNDPELLFEIDFLPGEMFNDITTDPYGRIFGGTLRHGTRDGKLYRIENGVAPVVVLEDLGCSNGMTFSLDQRIFYHTDSHDYRITQYRYDVKSGQISEPEVFYQGSKDTGLPDGVTIDTDGNLWSAFWGAGCVRKFSKGGALLKEISLPVSQPTSVMFGGKDLTDLYVTTASMNGGTAAGGPLFCQHTEAEGRMEWLAQF